MFTGPSKELPNKGAVSPKRPSAIAKTMEKTTSPHSSYTRSARRKSNERLIKAIDDQMTQFIKILPKRADFYESQGTKDCESIPDFFTRLRLEEKRFAAGDVVKVLISIHCM